MLNLSDARKVVEAELATIPWPPEDELIVLPDMTIEKPYGWIFFYTSRLYRAGNKLYAVGGNGPIVVNKESGLLDHLGSAKAPDIAIADFEKLRHGKLVD